MYYRYLGSGLADSTARSCAMCPRPIEGKPGGDGTCVLGRMQLFVEPEDADKGSLDYGRQHLTTAPWGHLIVCEDNYSDRHLRNHMNGVTPDGKDLHYRPQRLHARTASSRPAFLARRIRALFVNIYCPGAHAARSQAPGARSCGVNRRACETQASSHRFEGRRGQNQHGTRPDAARPAHSGTALTSGHAPPSRRLQPQDQQRPSPTRRNAQPLGHARDRQALHRSSVTPTSRPRRPRCGDRTGPEPDRAGRPAPPCSTPPAARTSAVHARPIRSRPSPVLSSGDQPAQQGTRRSTSAQMDRPRPSLQPGRRTAPASGPPNASRPVHQDQDLEDQQRHAPDAIASLAGATSTRSEQARWTPSTSRSNPRSPTAPAESAAAPHQPPRNPGAGPEDTNGREESHARSGAPAGRCDHSH